MAKSKKMWLKILLISTLIDIVIVGAIFGVLYITKNKDNEQDTKIVKVDERVTTLETQVNTIKSELGFLGKKVNTIIDDDGKVKVNFDVLTQEEFDRTIEIIDNKLNELEQFDSDVFTYNFNSVDFSYDYSSYTNSFTLICKNKIIRTVTIPETFMLIPVGTLGFACFKNCTSLESIVIPDSVTSFNPSCFAGCTSLESITIPDSVTFIGNSSFMNCTSLESVVIPDSVTDIQDSCFYGCTSLKSITISNSVVLLGIYTFKNCTSLESIVIPDSVTDIGEDCFDGCTSLISLELPAHFENTDKTEWGLPEGCEVTYRPAPETAE